MKKLLLSFLLVLGASSVLFSQKTINHPNAEKRNVSGFHGIDVATGIKLILTEGSSENVAVSAATAEFRDKIVTKVENGILKIHYDSKLGAVNKRKESKGLKAYVSYKTLDLLYATTGAEVEINEVLKSSSLDLKANTGAMVNGKVDITTLKVIQNTGSKVTLTGRAGKLDIDGDTGSKFKGEDMNTALFLTKGKGYYEQYKAEEDYSAYRMPYPVNGPDTIFSSDFIRQLWLDNYFYGTIYSLHYKAAKTELTIGGGLTTYDGNHFGKLTWASNGLTSLKNWYDNDALKTDFNIYLKQQTQLNNYWNLFYDIQFRYVSYKIEGFRNNPGLIVNNKFSFFNPKAGIVYKKDSWKSYLSYSVANKEPNRDDFEAGNTQQPKPERLQDFELGIEKSTKQLNWSATLYYMKYKDQLVLTGKINDVGAYTRTNIPESFRAGIELQGGVKFNSWINTTTNLTLSRNKVIDFEEYIDDYDNGGQKINSFSSADIAFSPSITGAGSINVLPFKNTEISFISKYVSKQFLDNTGNNSRSLNSFYVQDIRAIYTIKKKWLKEVTITGQVNNLFNKEYEPNGYTYSYIWGGETITENYYFPMSGTNFIIAVNIRL